MGGDKSVSGNFKYLSQEQEGSFFFFSFSDVVGMNNPPPTGEKKTL